MATGIGPGMQSISPGSNQVARQSAILHAIHVVSAGGTKHGRWEVLGPCDVGPTLDRHNQASGVWTAYRLIITFTDAYCNVGPVCG